MREISLDDIRNRLKINEYKLDYKGVLNPEQYEAACAKDGNFLVLAGAGTGKTNTLVYRVAKLIEDMVPPESILLLTFTKKAAMEMTQRANGILDNRCSKIYSGTYHSFASNMLRRYGKNIGLANNFTILDESDAKDVVDLVRTELGLDKKERKFPKKAILLDIFSSSINKNKSIEDIVFEFYPDYTGDINDILKCCEKYTEFKRAKHLLDYDDLLVRLYELLCSNDTVCDAISRRFQYIMVDEYQDSNIIQAKILKKLSSVHKNLLVVGDPNQSIYGFRGGNFENIMNFEKEFDNVKVIKLFKNYRSIQPILDLSNELMKQTDQTYYNPLVSDKVNDSKPELIYVPNEYTQSMYIAQEILNLYEEGTSLKDICVLTRNMYLTGQLQVMLTSANIKFKVVGGRKFLDAKHIKDIIALVKILVNPNDTVAWLRILQLFDGVGPSVARAILSNVEMEDGYKLKEGEWLTNLSKKKYHDEVVSLIKALDSCTGRSFQSQFDAIVKFYTPVMENCYDDWKMRLNDVDVFTTIAGKYKSGEEFLTDITLEPSEVSVNVESDEEEDCLTISTIHSAKGLEWEATFLVHAVDGVIPSAKSLDSYEDIAEELRILYVALTRAKKKSYIMVPAEKYTFGRMERSQISRFLSNVPNLNSVVNKARVR